jgi:hypothetical protein
LVRFDFDIQAELPHEPVRPTAPEPNTVAAAPNTAAARANAAALGPSTPPNVLTTAVNGTGRPKTPPSKPGQRNAASTTREQATREQTTTDSADAKRYFFSVYRPLTIDPGDVRLEISTRLTVQGELEVVQRFIHWSERPLSFRCELHAPSRPQLSSLVSGPAGQEILHLHRLPKGAELIGKRLRLRAEEIGGERTLNSSFIAVE